MCFGRKRNQSEEFQGQYQYEGQEYQNRMQYPNQLPYQSRGQCPYRGNMQTCPIQSTGGVQLQGQYPYQGNMSMQAADPVQSQPAGGGGQPVVIVNQGQPSSGGGYMSVIAGMAAGAGGMALASSLLADSGEDGDDEYTNAEADIAGKKEPEEVVAAKPPDLGGNTEPEEVVNAEPSMGDNAEPKKEPTEGDKPDDDGRV